MEPRGAARSIHSDMWLSITRAAGLSTEWLPFQPQQPEDQAVKSGVRVL